VVTGVRNQKNVYGMQASHQLLGASVRWQVNPYLDVALSGDNLTNETYTLNSGFGYSEGPTAAGRNIRLAFTGRY
jgi:outer membrane receptor protein involved in Fe transport